jgi:hypothetical protein
MDRKDTDAARREFLVQGSILALGCLCGRALAADEKAPAGELDRIAYCCIDCDKCEAYKATIENDDALRAKVAKSWQMKPEQINCLGCKSQKALFNCSLKQCAAKRGVATCAHCPDFATCKDEQWTKYPGLRKTAEAMRAKLEAAKSR